MLSSPATQRSRVVSHSLPRTTRIDSSEDLQYVLTVCLTRWTNVLFRTDLSAGDRYDIGQTISFQLHDTYEHITQFPAQILLNSFTILLATRLKLTQERIRNVLLGKDNSQCRARIAKQSTDVALALLGRATVSFQLFELPSQTPTNEQVIHHLRHLINKQTLNLLDPNRCVLNTIIGSVVVGRN